MDDRPIYASEIEALALRDRGKQAFDSNDFAGAQTLFQQSLDLLRAQTAWDPAFEISLLDWLGFLAQKQRRWDEAKCLHDEQLRLARRAKDRESIAAAHHRLGDAFLEMKAACPARCHLAASLRHFRRLPDQPRTEVPHLFWDLAKLAEETQNLPAVRTHLLTLVRYLNEHRDPQASNAYYHLGRIAGNTGALAEAEEMFYNCLLAAQETGNALGQGYAYLGLARTYRDKKRPQQARHFLAECVRMGEMGRGDAPLLGWAHRLWGGLDWSANQMPAALRHYALGVHFAQRARDIGEVCLGLDSAAAALLSMGHPAAATQALGRASALREGRPNLPDSGKRYHQSCEGRLGAERFREWFQIGQMMTVESVVHITLRIADAQPDTFSS